MFSEDIEMEEMYSITSFADRYDGHELLKMKAWMADRHFLHVTHFVVSQQQIVDNFVLNGKDTCG
ncbi:hypothetical protein YC2023_099178 [Brassica napus]